jgi:CubicO group peptidase (beta-lactamase class C family)
MRQLDNFDGYIEDAMQSWHCPGVAVAVIKGDELFGKKAYGFSKFSAF